MDGLGVLAIGGTTGRSSGAAGAACAHRPPELAADTQQALSIVVGCSRSIDERRVQCAGLPARAFAPRV